ncbi:carbamoyltransferase HypF [Helicobacter turcicus]|uniref:Carbamoyltransferase n=1 Tax=Helicobacter turcicus TaxID=2867412 RepID=A0ABS7JLQ0_9HELI|nr:carbamoyltransferase HypF [Helicobacter turcicus]MBX7490317.1 carbamoyltransferase HypF [Helicobacter turcicus]MBX7545104.1 carbamoyltransferase HypF [Helicobacter turcicus]
MLKSLHKTYEFHLQGVVQGVGFRPFVYRIAKECGIFGYVRNTTEGVFILAQGTKEALEYFECALQIPPKVAKITRISKKEIKNAESFFDFSIAQSIQENALSATIPADIALCDECLEEIRNSKNRRFSYPFCSCTNCGGRYSLIHTLPYDRKNTAMAEFEMCEHCKEEYENPNSRRFHSEINCCYDCGPKLFFAENLDKFKFEEPMEDSTLCKRFGEDFLEEPLHRAVKSLKQGKILAIKGIGGYALVCNGLNAEAIATLRVRKNRPQKPFALMCKDMKMAESYVHLSALQKEILSSSVAPILLTKSKDKISLPLFEIAPNLATLGVILPYAPLHYLLFEQLDFPLIFTSANLSGEPIIKDFYRVVETLVGVCDGVLLYNRNILNSIDDSLVRTLIHNGKEEMQILRRARGFLCDIALSFKTQQDFIALGAQQKATFCLKTKNKILLSPHLGDLENVVSVENFLNTQKLFLTQYKIAPRNFVLDLHPNYAQRGFVSDIDKIQCVQHHFAHLLSNVAENAINTKVLGVIFDGTGYGETSKDSGKTGKIWGGEFFEWNPSAPLEYQRIAYFDDFSLLGGERAIKDVRRLGLSLIFESFEEEYKTLVLPLLREFSQENLEIFYTISKKVSRSAKVPCNSVGRLFDGVSALCGVCAQSSYEGEGGMVLESLALSALKSVKNKNLDMYMYTIKESVISYQGMVREICKELEWGMEVQEIALKFHNTLAEIIAEVAQDYTHIALSGGCFQNALLTQLVLEKLKNKVVYLNKEIPCNDGGISVGQAYFMNLCLTYS